MDRLDTCYVLRVLRCNVLSTSYCATCSCYVLVLRATCDVLGVQFRFAEVLRHAFQVLLGVDRGHTS